VSGYSVSPQAVEDLFEIWQYIARDDEAKTAAYSDDRTSSARCDRLIEVSSSVVVPAA
jgi:plasmid stabilization system protein ParE